MRYSILFFIIIGCSTNEQKDSKEDNLDEMAQRNNDSSLTIEEKYEFENLQIRFDRPIKFASTKNIAIPIIYEEIERDKMDYERTHFNVAVLSDTGSTPLLIFNDPVEISHIETIERRLLTRLETYDYNDDYYYNEDDEDEVVNLLDINPVFESLIFITVKRYCNPEYDCKVLYIYDLKNLKLYQLNDDQSDFISWTSINDDSKIMVKYHIDNNHDNKLDDKDDENFMIYDLNSHSVSPPVFDIDALRLMKLNLVKSKKE